MAFVRVGPILILAAESGTRRRYAELLRGAHLAVTRAEVPTLASDGKCYRYVFSLAEDDWEELAVGLMGERQARVAGLLRDLKSAAELVGTMAARAYLSPVGLSGVVRCDVQVCPESSYRGFMRLATHRGSLAGMGSLVSTERMRRHHDCVMGPCPNEGGCPSVEEGACRGAVCTICHKRYVDDQIIVTAILQRLRSAHSLPDGYCYKRAQLCNHDHGTYPAIRVFSDFCLNWHTSATVQFGGHAHVVAADVPREEGVQSLWTLPGNVMLGAVLTPCGASEIQVRGFRDMVEHMTLRVIDPVRIVLRQGQGVQRMDETTEGATTFADVFSLGQRAFPGGACHIFIVPKKFTGGIVNVRLGVNGGVHAGTIVASVKLTGEIAVWFSPGTASYVDFSMHVDAAAELFCSAAVFDERVTDSAVAATLAAALVATRIRDAKL